MSIPAGAPVPDVVRELARGREVIAIWHNEIGGLTFEVGDEIVKWFPSDHWEIDFADEGARLAWAAAYAPVPQVIAHGRRGEQQWLQMQRIDAESAVHPSNVLDPAVTVAALGRGLRRWHDTLPVADCRYRWDIESRLAALPADPQPDHVDTPSSNARSARCGSNPVDSRSDRCDNDPADPDLIDLAARAAAMERDLVVCHGDACSPNFLVRDGQVVAYVDLGSLGVGDRWADLAPALRSLTWNFGEGWEQTFLDAYQIEFDSARFDYYSRLWAAV